MATTTFDNLITFSRGSNATVTGPNGLIQWAPANLLTNSQDFEAAAWTKSAGGVGSTPVVTANAGAAPDGTQTADQVVFNLNSGTTSSDFSWLIQAYTATAGATYATSVWLRTLSGTAKIIVESASQDANLVDVTSTWTQVSGIRLDPTGGSRQVRIGLRGSNVVSGQSSSCTLLIWGAQLELGSTATTYNNTSVRNLLGFSEAFDNAAWTKSGASIVTGAQANPVNGLFNAQKLMEDTANSGHQINQAATTSANPFTFSVYAKAAGRNFVALGITDSGSTVRISYFDLANGVTATVATGITASIVSIGNGWYRCAVTVAAAFAGSNLLRIYATNVGNNATYTGDGNSGIYIYGAMLSNSASLDPYVPTPGAAPSSTAYYGPRFDYDPVTLLPRGLLVEEARTNLLTYSAEFDNAAWTKNNSTVTANATTSPDGTVNADKLAETAVTSSFSAVQAPTLAFSTTYTFSCYMKAAERTFGVLNIFTGAASCWTWFNLSTGVVSTLGAGATATIAAVGNGWYRCTLTIATAASGSPNIAIFPAATNGALSYAGAAGSGIFIWGAQLEAGTFATSYIPTIASTVTRSADIATITGSLFSQWYNQPEGAFLVEASSFAEKTGINAYNFTSVNDGTGNNFIRTYVYLNQAGETVRTGAVIQAEISTTPWSQNVPLKLAAVYKTNDFQAALNGTLTAADTAGTLPAVTQMNIGTNNGQGGPANGHIRSIRYVPVRAADFQLQQVTT